MYGIYPPYQATQYLPQLQPLQQPISIQYVNDLKSAESFQMPASSSVILMDANLPRFYMKQTDASGVATIKSYDFKETEAEKPKEYVTKEEFEKFKANLKGAKNESTNDNKQPGKQ